MGVHKVITTSPKIINKDMGCMSITCGRCVKKRKEEGAVEVKEGVRVVNKGMC